MDNPERAGQTVPLNMSMIRQGAEFTIGSESQVELGPIAAISIPAGEIITVNQIHEHCFSINMSSGIRAIIPNRVVEQIKVQSEQ